MFGQDWYADGGLHDQQVLQSFEITRFQPFDPVHKRTEASVKAIDEFTFKVTKGSPQVIIALAANVPQVQAVVERAVDAGDTDRRL